MNEWILLTSIVCVKPDVSSSSAYCCPKTVKTHTLVVRFDSIPQHTVLLPHNTQLTNVY